MPLPLKSTWSYLPDDIWGGVQFMKLLIV
jgi:hypothetical protein